MSRNPGFAGSPRWASRLAPPLLLAALVALPSLAAQDPAEKKAADPAEKKPATPAEKKAARKARVRKEDGSSRWEQMDYGRFLTASVHVPTPGQANNANKGIVIRLGSDKDRPAAFCFDTDLLRAAGGWTGGFLHLYGTPFDGSHGSWPAARGTTIFGTYPGPGWSRGEEFHDPRPEPFGPIPADWAKYKGLYRSGDRVVLSYTVGDVPVLEMPWIEGEKEEKPVITRTFNVGPTRKPLMLVVSDVEATDDQKTRDAKAVDHDVLTFQSKKEGPVANQFVTVVGAPKGSMFRVSPLAGGSRCVLVLAPSALPIEFRVFLGGAADANPAKFGAIVKQAKEPLNLARHTKGGPSQWPKTVETKGKLGAGDGPYVVDTLTAPPEENPYKSWIRFGGMDFFADGTRAALTTWSGDVWVVSGIDDKLEKLTWKRFAAGLFQPLGLKIVDDQVYTLGRDGITKLVDLDGDGEADRYEAFNHDMAATTGFHEFAFDLQTDPEGNFYFSKAAPVKGGGRGFDHVAANSGTVMKVYKDGKTFINYATGLRAPNGIGVGPDGQVTSGDNEGTWMPKCRLNWIKPGGFYGVVDTAHRQDKPTMYDEPICWFPKDVDNSGGGQTWVTSTKWGPFAGRLLHTSYGTCSLFLALVDPRGEHVQGGVVRFPVNFLSGIMRPRFNPRDGQLYVAGLRGWQTSAAQDACFQRVRYTGKPANMATGLVVKKDALELTFTDPLDPEDAADADSYQVEQWNYLWCSEYGSDDYSAKTPDFEAKVRELNKLREDPDKNGPRIEEITKSFRKGRDEVKIESAQLSPDGKTVTLAIPGLKPVMQMRIRGKLKAADGKKIPLEVYNTINFVPGA